MSKSSSLPSFESYHIRTASGVENPPTAMALSPFLVVFIVILAAATTVAGGASIHRLLSPDRFNLNRLRVPSEEQNSHMRFVRRKPWMDEV